MTWWWFIQPVPLTLFNDYNGGTEPIYVCETAAGTGIPLSTLKGLPVWRIRLLTYDGNGNVITQQFSPLYASFGDIANNRNSLQYS